LTLVRINKAGKRNSAIYCLGLSSNEIADILFISLLTVNTHRQNIIKKIGTSKIAEIIKFAMTFDLIS